jgi:VanZ family protein
MRPGLLRTTLRVLTWLCVVVLAVLSLTPGEEIEPLRTDLPGQVEHIIAYAGSGAIAMAGYGLNRGAVRVIGSLWVYAAILEYLQHFSPGRNPAVVDFAASALGVLCRRGRCRAPLALALGSTGTGTRVAVFKSKRRSPGRSRN